MSEKTIPELLQNRVKEHGTRLLFQRRDGWSWKQITWLDFDRKVKNIASFLMHSGFGMGDRALIASSNRLEAISTELAILFLGGVMIPLSGNKSVEEIVGAANEYNAKFIFLEHGEGVLEGMIGSMELMPNVLRIAVSPDVKISHERIINFKAMLKVGLMKRKKLQDELTEASRKVDAGSIAALFIQSGSTDGRVMEVSQGTLLTALRSTSEQYPNINGEDQSFSFLPTASPYAKFINHLTLYKASRAAVAETMTDFYQDILEVKPTIIFETRDGLEDICKYLLSGLNGQDAGRKLRADLGSRVNYVFTDYMPTPETERVLRSAGITLIEVPELNGLLS